MSIEQKSHTAIFRNGSVHELYRLKGLITLEQLITSVVEKKNYLNEQNFEVYWKTRSEDRRWRMMGREGKSVKTESRQKNVVPEIVVPKES